MPTDPKSNRSLTSSATLLIFCILIFSIYSNTLDASWHLDDYHIIPQNPGVHLTDLSFASITKAATADPWTGDRLFRPVAMVSFAMNWLIHQEALAGYHIVNIVIHVATAFVLFLCILALLKAPRLNHVANESRYFIALTAALLWALNPLQVQAVTYIVQRMASLAALFSISGILFYLRARRDTKRWSRVFHFGCCGLMFLLALGSKENAIVMPLSIFLVELVCFQHVAFRMPTPKTVIALTVGTLLLGILAVGVLFVSWGGAWEFLSGLYAKRPFSLTERLLTETRILWHYLSLLFYPTPTRLSIEHDVVLSTSLIHPWTTLLSILALMALIGNALAGIRKYPLLTLAVLFFFINHIPESTVLPMELVFEHRNYLPSMFLFVPIAAAIKRAIDRYREHNRPMAIFLTTCVALLMVGFGSGTYIRNMAWASELTLWQDAHQKSPLSPRPLVNLAFHYFEPNGRMDIAVALNRKALQLMEGQSRQIEALCYNNIGNYHRAMGEYDEALRIYDQALTTDPDFVDAQFGTAVVLSMKGQIQEALEGVDGLIAKHGEQERYLELKGLILVAQNRPDAALAIFRQALSRHPTSRNALINIGATMTMAGYNKQADWFLSLCRRLHPTDGLAMMIDVINLLNMGNTAKAASTVDKWIDENGMASIEADIKGYTDTPLAFPLPYQNFTQLLSERLIVKTESLNAS